MDAERRRFLKKAAIGGVVSSFLPLIAGSAAVNPKNTSRRVLRIAHITDVHILDQRNAETSFARVMSEINSMKDKPDLIINTGDTVMDENKQTKEVVTTRWNSWQSVVNQNKIRMYSALGNHDVWTGPNESLDAAYRQEKQYGKQWAIDMLTMPDRFYSFEKNGWQFIALDSINGPHGNYQLDDLQFEWLQGELKSIPPDRPVCIFNHVPIISIAALMYLTQRSPAIETCFPAGDMHLDHQRIKDLFFKHKNVKLCLSGHVHYLDAVQYLGVKYLCNGAVSGNWWRENFVLDEFPPVYSIIDLYADGTSELQTVYYRFEV